MRVAPTQREVLRHEGHQVRRALVGKRRYEMKKEYFTAKTILVMDEASLVGAKDMQRLLRAADRAETKIVLVGDRLQFEAIQLPGAYEHLVEKYGAAKLEEIHRQHEPWHRDAVAQLAAGDVRGALTQFALAGRAHVCANQRAARRELAIHWNHRRTKDVANSLMIARTREAVAELNVLAQATRHQNGELGKILKQRLPDGWAYSGDRGIFTRNNKRAGFLNGDLGTVERIGLDTLKIRLDRTERRFGLDFNILITLPASEYKQLQLGYAVTAHKAQGMTVDRAFVATELSDLQPQDKNELRMAYVQLSRAREETQVFLTTWEAGDDLGQLAERARQKQEQSQQQTFEEARRFQEQQQYRGPKQS